MSEKGDTARRPGNHPELALIAAHVDRRLSGEERSRMDEHLATCPRCFEIYSETVLFKQQTEPQESGGFRAWSVFAMRPALQVAAGIAAVLVLAAALTLWVNRSGFLVLPASSVAALVEAVGERRLIEPRLTGGFRYARLLVMRSGEGPQGLDAQPPAVLAAVARIREQAEKDPSPEALGALGVTYLVSGDVGAAVKALESATAQTADNPRLWSDLAAAYLARARQLDEPADIPKALEAAERAVALPDPPTEAWFNRALALEALHLDDAAKKAWEDYLARDASSGWADEARRHLDALNKIRKSSAWEDKALVRTALAEGPPAVDLLADESPQALRTYFDEELLPAWADATLLGRPEADIHREHAWVLGEALARTTTDVMIRDTARALSEPLSPTSRDALRAQAEGFRAHVEAKRLNDNHPPSSCTRFRDAIRDLEAGGSPYASWPRLQAIFSCSYPTPKAAGLVELDRLESLADRRGYVQLLGRVRWLRGLTRAYQTQLTTSLDQYRLSRGSFQLVRDRESEAQILALIAEDLRHLGEARNAWRERLMALAFLGSVRASARRQGMLSSATRSCVEEGLPRTARHFGDVLVEESRNWSRPIVVSQALLRRAGIHHELGSSDLARADLRDARRWIEKIGDKHSTERWTAEADTVEGEMLVHAQPEEAARLLARAQSFFVDTAPSRIPRLCLMAARARMELGQDDGAETQLLAGIQAFEDQRTPLRDPNLRVSFFGQALPLFDDMVRLQIARRRDPERALAFVERGRARQLVESLGRGSSLPLGPEELRGLLPEGLALVYYLPLSDRLFGWALTSEGSHFVERDLPVSELSRLVAAYRSALERRASVEILRMEAGRLHEELVRPLLPFLASQRTLVFVPDALVQSVPFASLWDVNTRRYLVEDHLVGLAPSGTVFVRASGKTAAVGSASRVLVVGNPMIDRGRWRTLPGLPQAEAEAAEVASLYGSPQLLTGKGATKSAFLRAVVDSEVVHFAGHAVAGSEGSEEARLLLARDENSGDSGVLALRELDKQSLRRTRVVVLAACQTALGARSPLEGVLSLGRPFLAAGVSHVVASLWNIDDTVSRRFLVAFHRALREERDPARALRTAQLSFVHDSDPSLSHPASWAAFISMGGLDIHSLPKGVIS